MTMHLIGCDLRCYETPRPPPNRPDTFTMSYDHNSLQKRVPCRDHQFEVWLGATDQCTNLTGHQSPESLELPARHDIH
jgi:hypothetical protein